MLGNDVNLRDVEGRSALLLGKAKDNNASCAVGPMIRLFDHSFTIDHVRNMQLALRVEGEDGYVLNGAKVYSVDLRLPGMLHAAIMDCPVFGGKLVSFDDAQIKTRRGVRGAVRVNESTVAVVADTWWRVKSALEALTIVWDEGPNAKVTSATIAAQSAGRPNAGARWADWIAASSWNRPGRRCRDAARSCASASPIIGSDQRDASCAASGT